MFPCRRPVMQRDVDDFKYRQGKDNQIASHSLHVVGTLRTDLADATKTFKDLLQQRSTNVKEQFDRRTQFGMQNNNALTLGEQLGPLEWVGLGA